MQLSASGSINYGTHSSLQSEQRELNNELITSILNKHQIVSEFSNTDKADFQAAK